MKKYRHLILGGTFDHLHAGHELFLRTALEKTAKRLTIGITTPGLISNKGLSETIESFAEREKNVQQFVAGFSEKNKQVNTIQIHDIYGSSLTDVTIDGIVVTAETERGADMVNKKRKDLGMKPLDVILVPLVIADDGVPISSFRIRYGDIDRQGLTYYKHFSGTNSYQLPDDVRPRLREPLGDLIKGTLEEQTDVVKKILATISHFSPPAVITIGDIIYQSMLLEKFNGILGIIDLKSRRKALIEQKHNPDNSKSISFYRNRPGTISPEAVKAIRDAKERYLKNKKTTTVFIDGEEDLLALPAILLAPLDSVVLYGQFDQGVVLVRVTEQRKKEVLSLLKLFAIGTYVQG